jgi:hypothetical protein
MIVFYSVVLSIHVISHLRRLKARKMANRDCSAKQV